MNGKTTKEENDITEADVKKIAEQVANDMIYKYVTSKEEKVYNKLDKVPKWGNSTVKKLLDKCILKGIDKGLDLSYTFFRLLVLMIELDE